jgi:hypothetical protein
MIDMHPTTTTKACMAWHGMCAHAQDLEVTREKLVAQSATHRLAIALPYPVKDQDGSAKWTQEDCTLSVTLPIIRDLDYL